MQVTARTFELGKGGKLIPVSSDGMTDLQPGTRLHWGGPYEHDSIIISKKTASYGVTYRTLNPDDETLSPHFVEAHSIKRKDDPSLWHSQHYFIIDDPVSLAEVDRLREQAEALNIERDKQSKADVAIIQEKITRGKEIYKRLKPATAKALIVAEYDIDDCDTMTDYYSTKTGDRMILAWSNHHRDIFSEMRKAAAKFDKTKHLATAPDVDRNCAKRTEKNKDWWHPADEHREKYSMGAGYYLKFGNRYSDGWTVKKESLNYGIEHIYILLADGNHKLQEPAKEAKPKTTARPGITINEEKNGIEIRFPEKPETAILDKLKSAGWRWSRFSFCWYNRNTAENMIFASTII